MRSYYKTPRFLINLFTFALATFLLTACFGSGGSGEEGGENPEVAPTPVVRTVCNEACRVQGQCGNNVDGQIFVLGREDQPTTREHTQLFPHDGIVNKLNVQDKLVRYPGGVDEIWQFSQVQMVEGGQTGWVANMCLIEQ